MGKSSRADTAARAAQMRAEAARQERQRKQVIAAVVAVVVVIAAVVVGVVVANRPADTSTTPASGADAALAKLTSLPLSTLDSAPAPTAQQAPTKLPGASPLTQDGKPKVLYVGAEYCPFCAMERWALIGAMSQFGTFSGLKPTTSSSTDVHPDTPTWSFTDATFASDVLAFQGVETEDREGKPLQTLDGENAQLFQKYNPNGGIPWITYGGTHATSGATVGATALDGKTYDQIIAGIEDPSSTIGKAVDPAMTMITAQLCEMTQGKPANVCTSPGVKAASALVQR